MVADTKILQTALDKWNQNPRNHNFINVNSNQLVHIFIKKHVKII